MKKLLAGASMLCLFAAPAAFAQAAGTSRPTADDSDAQAESAVPTSSRQAATSPEVIVTGVLQQSERDVLQGTSVLSGEALTRNLRPTIGETLARLPGVSATSFGPTASRPILRGFQGERIRVLTDGIGSIDVSNTSVDHAVVIDPLLAERIEVLRGPSALLFGSSAVGGVVNVVDTRIPRTVPENGYRLAGIANYGSAANERSVEGAGDVAVGQHLVLHADGSYLKTDNLRIGGYALSPAARAAALSQVGLPQTVDDGEEPIDFAASAAIRNKLPNSFSETWTAGAGASIITDTGSLGVSYSHYDSFYGIPIRYATEVGQEQEAPRLDVVQNRYDLRGEVETGGGFLDRIRIRMGHANYRHLELEEDGSVGTAFYNNGTEGRLELVQARKGAWSGASGVQYFNRLFNVVGDEAFLPRNETNQTGLFTVQQLDFGALKAEGGVRYEWTDLAAKTDVDNRFFVGQRSFHALSASLGASYGIGDAIRIGINGSHTERAPSAEELFANGGHAGTQAYELGSPDFRLEKSWGLEATFHAHTDRVNFDASAYYNWFSNYISENQVAQSVCEVGAVRYGRADADVDLPCFQYQQADARYYGFEADLSAKLFTVGTTRFNADVLGDYVHANIKDVGPVPRIPPLRVLGGLEAQGDAFTARAEVEHVFDQNRVADFETPTSDYTMVNASLSLSPFGRDSKTQLVLSANNLFDVTARRHASFLKDFAPLAGRDLRATLRFGL
ncbi:iron complex outermembrane recepter protein [Sphingomonas gellani]|uniref:Iron complex outermembrane recepter protein n=1 Tax=Sphingomonas gellani TaxID=1166340 RepID=A0A1H8DSQ7_9SPHN|nr:TonB-dependent receptor [Sphingomonas gellani]SEN09884.1 iron complex outermembrane recepter protein [Sphingomonas gellani]